MDTFPVFLSPFTIKFQLSILLHARGVVQDSGISVEYIQMLSTLASFSMGSLGTVHLLHANAVFLFDPRTFNDTIAFLNFNSRTLEPGSGQELQGSIMRVK